jgi:hypothetical protein
MATEKGMVNFSEKYGCIHQLGFTRMGIVFSKKGISPKLPFNNGENDATR